VAGLQAKQVTARIVPDFSGQRRRMAASFPIGTIGPIAASQGRRRAEAKEATMRFHSFFVAVCVFAAASTPGFAEDAGVNPPPEKCRAEPQPDSQGQQESTDNNGQAASRSLTEKLAPCDGVLAPPAVGDQEMTQPPPADGEMPVIKPRDLPQQQQPNDQ
jgi:hypothetical protein